MAEGQAFGESWLPLGILAFTIRLIREHRHRVMAAVAAMSATGVAPDTDWGGSGATLIASVVAIAMQYWLTASLLADLGLRSVDKPRFLAFFLASILTGACVLAGLVLGLVPGLIHLAGWWIATVAVIAGEGNAFESIAYSWRATRGHSWEVLGIAVAVLAPFVIVFGLLSLVLFQSPAEQGAFAFLLVCLLELVLSVGLVVSWHSAIAINVLTRRRTFVSEIFA